MPKCFTNDLTRGFPHCLSQAILSVLQIQMNLPIVSKQSCSYPRQLYTFRLVEERFMSKEQIIPQSQTEAPEKDALKSYLDYYKSLDRPGFAVLVTGAWGSGKTFQVDAVLKQDQFHYISLFGLSSASEIYGAVLAKAFPEIANRKKLAKWLDGKTFGARGISLPVGSLVAAALDATAQERVDNTQVIVFDDVERWAGDDFKVLLGAINYYVEHHGCRVILIANDDKIVDLFSETKEKVVGQTLRVSPQTNEAFKVFLISHDRKAQKFLDTHRSTILKVFALSESGSLRILRNTMASIGRFFKLLDDVQVDNYEAVRSLLSLFVAISIEVQRGDLFRSELAERIQTSTLVYGLRSKKFDIGKDEERKERIEKFGVSQDRYKSLVDISFLFLSDELLVDMIVDGIFSKQSLQSYLTNTDHFETADDQPAWRRFMSFDSLRDDFVNQAATEMDQQFDNRKVTSMGELMHIVSLRIMRVKEGLMAGSREQIVIDVIRYLDDLVANGSFPLQPDIGVFGHHPAHGGAMLWGYEENVDVLNRIRDHFFKCEKQTLQKYFPVIKNRILEAIEDSPEKLGALLDYSKDENAEYQTIPALLSLTPKELVDAFLKLPVEKWRATQRVLSKRLGMVSTNNSLAEEAKWFDEFETEMLKMAAEQKGTIIGLRIKRHLPQKQ